MKKLKTIWYSCLIIYIVTLIYAFYVNWQGKYFGMTFVACLTPWILPVLMKILHIKVPLEFYIINLVLFILPVFGEVALEAIQRPIMINLYIVPVVLSFVN